MAQNESLDSLLAKVSVGTVKNEPLNIWGYSTYVIRNLNTCAANDGVKLSASGRLPAATCEVSEVFDACNWKPPG